jgi:Alpha/beta hydrolase domain
MILGTTRVFDEAELTHRYPGGQAEYTAAFRAATSRAVADGFVLAEDADEMVAVASAGYLASIP